MKVADDIAAVVVLGMVTMVVAEVAVVVVAMLVMQCSTRLYENQENRIRRTVL